MPKNGRTEVPAIDPEQARAQIEALDPPADLRKQLDETTTDLPVLLVFAPATITYGKLRRFIAPALSTHPIVHVYLEDPRRDSK